MEETDSDKYIGAINKLSDLPNLLEFIIAKKLVGTTLSYAKEKVRELWYERKYGFSPKPEEARKLKDISRSGLYHRLIDCVGKHHWSLPLVNTGIYISGLDKEDKEGFKKRNRDYIYAKHGEKGIKVMHLGDTGFIENVIYNLSDLKLKRNLSEIEAGEILDKIINEWTKITIFVKHDNTPKELSERICKLMYERHDLFLVFSFGKANKVATQTLAKLLTSGEISKNDYRFESNEDYYPARDKNKLGYMWSFKLIPKNLF